MIRTGAGRAPLLPPALQWFGCAWLGAWAGVRLVDGAAWAGHLLWPAAGTLLWAARALRRNDIPLARILVAVALFFSLATSAADRAALQREREQALTGAYEGILRGRIVSVFPYHDGAWAFRVSAPLPDGAPAGSRALVRLIAREDELSALLALHPPEGGEVAWPARLYPFLPPGNPGEFDRFLWAARQNLAVTAYPDRVALGLDFYFSEGGGEASCAPPDLDRLIAGMPAWRRSLATFSLRARCRIIAAAPGDGGAVARAIALGQKDGITNELSDAFSRSGLGHLLAVSGLHVGFVVALAAIILRQVAELLRRLTERRRQGAWGWAKNREMGEPPGEAWLDGAVDLALALTVIGYVLLVDGPASAVRAGVMALLLFAARRAKRRVDTWQLIGLAGLAILVYQPLYGVDLGFCLSITATAGVTAASRIMRSLGRGGAPRRGLASRAMRWIGDGLAISAGAQLATAPLAVSAFSVVPWASLAVNLVAVPIAAVGVGSLLLGAAAASIPVAGSFLLGIGGNAASLLAGMARAVASWGAFESAMPSPVGTIGWYAGLVGGYLVFVGRRQASLRAEGAGRRLFLLGSALWIAASWWPVVLGAAGMAELRVLDVGQGDAVLIRSGWGRAVLVDGGGVPGAAARGGYDVGQERVVPTLKRLGVRRLAMVVSTHPDEDHVHGLAAVVRERRVERVIASPATSTSHGYRAFVRAAEERGLPLEQVRVGDRVLLGDRLELVVLASGDDKDWGDGAWKRETSASRSVNDRSVAFAVESAGRRFLLLGDLEREGLKGLVARWGDRLSADGLLVPHHGSPRSHLPELYRLAAPEVAVISVGRNRYGHPSPEVIEAIERAGIRLLRTDRHGAVRIAWSSRGIFLASTRRPEAAESSLERR